MLLTLLEQHTILALATNNTHNKSRDRLESAETKLLKGQQLGNHMAGDGLISEKSNKTLKHFQIHASQ